MDVNLKDSQDRFRLYEVNIHEDENNTRTFMVAINQDRISDKWFYTINNVSGQEYDKNRYPTRVKELADDLVNQLNAN